MPIDSALQVVSDAEESHCRHADMFRALGAQVSGGETRAVARAIGDVRRAIVRGISVADAISDAAWQARTRAAQYRSINAAADAHEADAVVRALVEVANALGIAVGA